MHNLLSEIWYYILLSYFVYPISLTCMLVLCSVRAVRDPLSISANVYFSSLLLPVLQRGGLLNT